MATLHLLGTGAALSDPHRTTTMLAVAEGSSSVLVDCGGDALHRWQAAGLSLGSLDALILTHAHADHVSGFPLLMEKLWLSGRERPLPIYGIAQALEQAQRSFETFDTSGWEGLFAVTWHEVSLEEQAPVLETEQWTITASPGTHSVRVIGLRVESRATGGVVGYSCDTEPSPEIASLAHQADILVHEANGERPGHSSAEDAAWVARKAEAGRLLLVHLPPGDKTADVFAARQIFPATDLGDELGAYPF